jgi:hypothetical protein
MALEWVANPINVNAACQGYLFGAVTAGMADTKIGQRPQAAPTAATHEPIRVYGPRVTCGQAHERRDRCG